MPAAPQENRLALYSLSYSVSIHLGALTCIDVLGHVKRGKDLRSTRSTAVERGCSQNFMVKKKGREDVKVCVVENIFAVVWFCSFQNS